MMTEPAKIVLTLIVLTPTIMTLITRTSSMILAQTTIRIKIIINKVKSS